MSKITAEATNTSLQIYNIGSDSTKNYSRQGSFSDWLSNEIQMRALVFSLVNEGWHKNESLHVMPIEKEFEYNEEIEIRKTYFTNLVVKPFKVPTGEFEPNDAGDLKPVTEQIEISNSDLVSAYTGSLASKKPKYRQLDGYRRLTALPIANAIRIKMGKDPIKEIPVVKFDRELTVNEQLTLCVQENSLNNIGTQVISNLDRLVICRNMLKHGSFVGKSVEDKLTKLFGETGIKRTMCQKLANIIDLDNEFPQADLFGILEEYPANFKPIHKEVLRPLYKKPLGVKGEGWEPATQDEVVAYFIDPSIRNTAKQKKASSGANLRDGGKASRVLAFKELLTGASVGDLDPTIAKYDENAIYINHAINIIMEGDFESPVMLALTAYAEEFNTNLRASNTNTTEEA